jgi:ketosteroid isomerase-like protein
MKFTFSQTFLLIAVGIFICHLSCNRTTTSCADEVNKLLNLEKEAIEKEFQNDTAFLSSIMDTTFIELSKDKIKNKHEVLVTMFQNNLNKRENKISLDSFRLEEPIVHVYGNAAVVTFIMHTFQKKEDSLFEYRTRFYDVWVKRGSLWKAVTWQASPL